MLFFISAAVNHLFVLDCAGLIVDRVEAWSVIRGAQFPGPQRDQCSDCSSVPLEKRYFSMFLTFELLTSSTQCGIR